MTDDELTQTLAQILAEAGVGVWRPTGPGYTAGETGIYYGALEETTDRAVGVTVYAPVTDDVQTGMTERRVQIRCRGRRAMKNDADVLAGDVFAALHKLSRRAGLLLVRRESFAPLGPDGNGRQERTENYTVTIDNPEA